MTRRYLSVSAGSVGHLMKTGVTVFDGSGASDTSEHAGVSSPLEVSSVDQ